VARSSTTFIPRNAAVLADVDNINNDVGFWQPQPDFRIIERIDAVPSTFATFPDIELEAIYEELVKEFASYQTRVALRALERFPDADLLMIYIEQPDGSGHQFFLVDSRQAADPTDPNSIGNGQDPEKIARYQTYLATGYQTANNAVQSIIDAVGWSSSADGRKKRMGLPPMILLMRRSFRRREPYHGQKLCEELRAEMPPRVPEEILWRRSEATDWGAFQVRIEFIHDDKRLCSLSALLNDSQRIAAME